jgi:glutathione S-transferase
MITLYSTQACPYALRTRLALHEKGLAFEHVEIDLKNKPPEFLAVSRYGKVPALIDGDTEIYESTIINEYLDERYREPRLMPASPGERAHARIWIDFANTRMMPASAKIAFGKGDADKQAARDEFTRHCARVNDELAARAPWFLGEQYTLVDVTYASFYSRLERYAGLDLPEPLVAWWRRISERPAYAATGGLKPRVPAKVEGRP